MPKRTTRTKRMAQAFGRGYRKVANNPGITLGLVIGLFCALAVVAVRSEDTRDVTNRIVQESPCTADPASRECQQVKRESDKERSLADTCIPFRKALTATAFDEFTRCPGEGVVRQTSGSSPTQQPGPSGGRSETPVVPPKTEQPENGNGHPEAPGNPPPEPTAPNNPGPQPSEPTVPETAPLIDLTPVTKPVCDLTRPIAAIC